MTSLYVPLHIIVFQGVTMSVLGQVTVLPRLSQASRPLQLMADIWSDRLLRSNFFDPCQRHNDVRKNEVHLHLCIVLKYLRGQPSTYSFWKECKDLLLITCIFD